MGPLLILLFASSLVPVTGQKLSFLMTAPNVVHAGMDETITVQVFEAFRSVAVTVYFARQTGEALDIISTQKYTVELNQTNNFTKVIFAQVRPEKTNHLNFAREVQSVTLVAEISAPFEMSREAQIRLSSKPCFIYIETDKPIYAPNDTVRYRIFTLDQEMKPINCNVTVAVLDSEGTVLQSMSENNDSNSMHSGEISLRSEMTGSYEIRAKVSENSKYSRSKTFQVQNYELPKFDVRIIPDHWYYVVTEDNFSFTIQVPDGSDDDLCGVVKFGISATSGGKIPLPQLDQGHCIQNGTVRVILNTTALVNSIEHNGGMDQFNGGTLQIIAEMTDKGRHNETKALENISFLLSPYTVSLSTIKPYFTPGATFYVLASVTYPDGSPAAGVPLQVSISISGEKIIKDTNKGFTDQIGELSFSFIVPPNTQSIKITAMAGNKSSGIGTTHKIVMKHQSPSKRYLHINVPHVLLYPGDIITVTLTAISQLNIDDVQYYYYMVLSKGKVLDFKRVERTPETTFQLPITQDMVPYFRIVAYYVVDDNGRQRIIADSLQVGVESLCDTKFQVDSALNKHGESYQLLFSVQSDSAAKVFVQAVDTRLKGLNKQDTINAKMVFDTMDSYDLGSSYGSGNDTLGVFKDSGMNLYSNLMTLPSELPDEQLNQMPEFARKSAHGHLVSPTFDGSLMWELDIIPGNKTFRLMSNIHPPISWVIQALIMSAEDGLCVAKPKVVELVGRDFQSRISPVVQIMEEEAHSHGDDQLD
ncbi:complement C3-like isoform X2 [Heptranchias perlo]|uniref:complement C3-like isoform X2 n=1 Tax=Heptranchias perlo TaxID=212740 RepID=UPI00355A2C12